MVKSTGFFFFHRTSNHIDWSSSWDLQVFHSLWWSSHLQTVDTRTDLTPTQPQATLKQLLCVYQPLAIPSCCPTCFQSVLLLVGRMNDCCHALIKAWPTQPQHISTTDVDNKVGCFDVPPFLVNPF